MPDDLIATHPVPERDASRLLVLDRNTGQYGHATVRELPRLLRPRSLLVFNDTRVIPARLRGRKGTGGGVEVLLVRRVDPGPPDAPDAGPWREDWDVLVKSLGGASPGAVLQFEGGVQAGLLSRGERGAARLSFTGPGPGGLLAAAERFGAVPVPPYIEAARKRAGEGAAPEDRARYQTVFARNPGAVAAPTAGLHFTDSLLAELREAGHELCWITLHVGPGTFRPVEVEDPRDHQLDPEWYEISEAAAAAVQRARGEGRPVVAVGTTVVRTLETAGAAGEIRPGLGQTGLYILPGSPFRVITDLFTNFHLPRSSLLMLVAAFAGRERVLAAYAEAIAARYRFYSYGDAMFVTPAGTAP